MFSYVFLRIVIATLKSRLKRNNLYFVAISCKKCFIVHFSYLGLSCIYLFTTNFLWARFPLLAMLTRYTPLAKLVVSMVSIAALLFVENISFPVMSKTFMCVSP